MTDQAQLSQDLINEFVIVSHADLDKVKTMLAEHPALLNENAVWLETPIQAAAHVGNVDVAEFLLDQGAPLDICTAAMLGMKEEIAALLADDPALVNATGAHRIPLMFYPAIYGRVDVAEMLLKAGAPLNTEGGSQSPLHATILFKQTQMARWLLDHDANPYATDFDGRTAFERAEANDCGEIADMLRPFFAVDEET